MSKKPGDWWDESLNLIEGCTPISEACQNCWALQMLKRFRDQKPGQFRTYPRRVDILEKWRKSRRIFVGSLTDMLHEDAWPYLMMIIRRAQRFPQHTFVILTKRPHLIEDFKEGSNYHASPHTFYMKNLWFGITVENQARFDERWPHIKNHPFAVKFLHMEPLLGPVDISPALEHVQWVVVGSEQGQRKRLPPDGAIEGVVRQCKNAGVPVWVKQTPLGKDMDLWPEEIRFRELPNART